MQPIPGYLGGLTLQLYGKGQKIRTPYKTTNKIIRFL